jgi:hypothetical protein
VTSTDGHGLHPQLGADPTADPGDLIDPITDPAAADTVWADATTVEQFAADLAALAAAPPEVVEALRLAREN